MTGTTPHYGLTYPTAGDQVKDAISTIPEQLANDLESTLLGFGGIAAPGSWTAPSYGTGWVDWSDVTTVELCRYRKIGVEVIVEGFCQRTSGAGTAIMTLPAGFRPSKAIQRAEAVINSATVGIVSVSAAGVVSLSGVTNGQSVALFVRFFVDAP